MPRWVEASALRGGDCYLYVDERGKEIAEVKRLGGSFTVKYRGSVIAIRPDVETAKRAAEECHKNCE